MGLDFAVVGILHPHRIAVTCDENFCSHPVLPHVSLHAIPAHKKVSISCITII